MGAQTVVVACKFPRGLRIRCGSFQEVRVPTPGGTFATEKRWVANGNVIKINGPGRGMKSDDPDSANRDGFALTFNVDKEQMDQWLADNKYSPIVTSGMIKVHASRNELKAMTRELAGLKTGLEPLNPDGDPRTPRRVTREEDRPAA